MRLFLSVFLCMAFLTGTILGASTVPAHAQTAAAPAEQATASKFIQDLGDKAIALIADKNMTQAQKDDKYGDLLRASFDMDGIAKFVLGQRAWNAATPVQQQQYTDLFSQLVVKTYGARLNFHGEGFKVKSVRPETEAIVVVSSELSHPDGSAPTAIDWRVRQDIDHFAVIDVVVAGVSQSITQRQEYASILQRNNGNIEALLDMMRQRLQQSGSAQN